MSGLYFGSTVKVIAQGTHEDGTPEIRKRGGKVDIPTLSGMELREAVAKAKGYSVHPLPHNEGDRITYALVEPKGNFEGSWYFNREFCWKEAPKYESFIGDSFPLLLDMDEMGWTTNICVSRTVGEPNKRQLSVFCHKRNSMASPVGVYDIRSDSCTDPSDAIAKAYLLVKRRCE